jgi:hypothetical protein
MQGSQLDLQGQIVAAAALPHSPPRSPARRQWGVWLQPGESPHPWIALVPGTLRVLLTRIPPRWPTRNRPALMITPATVHPPGWNRRLNVQPDWTRGQGSEREHIAAAAAAAATTWHRTNKAQHPTWLRRRRGGGGGCPIPSPPPPGSPVRKPLPKWRHGNPLSEEVRESSCGESWATPPHSLTVRTLGENLIMAVAASRRG